jgi:hypothetical protein
VGRLRTAIIADDDARVQLPRQEIDERAFAGIAITEIRHENHASLIHLISP